MRLAATHPSHYVALDLKKVPRPIFNHFKLRMEERKITPEMLRPFIEWSQSKPMVPPGEWYIAFDFFYLCGKGQWPRTVLEGGRIPHGLQIYIPGYRPKFGKHAARYQTPPPVDPQTETPEFKAWFSGSQVTDKWDRPLVVYHGTPDKRFLDEGGEFQSWKDRYHKYLTPEAREKEDPGAAFWFAADPSTAHSYAKDKPAFDYQNSIPGVVAAYLCIRNPLILNNKGGRWKGQTDDTIREAREKGHDGIIIENTIDDYNVKGKRPTTTYAVFSSSQIKAAKGNSGKFDPGQKGVFAALAAAGLPTKFAAAATKAIARRKAAAPAPVDTESSGAKPLLTDKDIEGWTRYLTSMKFKTEQEAREWFFRKLERSDQESWAEMFGKNGTEKNRAIADTIPLYREGRAYKIGRKPKAPPVSRERLGSETPEGSHPNVNWFDRDSQDSGPVTEETILAEYNYPQGRKAIVYQAWVPLGEVPDPVCAEEEEDVDEEDRASYDWDDLRRARSTPPAKLLVHPNGKVVISDGNHRLRMWGERGYDCIPAWVIDQRRGVKLAAIGELDRSPSLAMHLAALRTISPQQAHDRKLFGPLYHGTTDDARKKIDEEGFIPSTEEGGSRNGYDARTYAQGVPPPLHHLGFGVYLTTVKSIAKVYNQNSTRGLVEYYVDAPRRETINFGSANTMMKWWVANGYDPAVAKKDRNRATQLLTDHLKSWYDAVWYKGKSRYKMLDGDQVVVFDPNRIYRVDPSLATGVEIGATVIRKADGVRGKVLRARDLTDEVANTYHKGNKSLLEVKWTTGHDYNVYATDVDPAPAKKPKKANPSAIENNPNFVRWFAGSKVVDSEGRPLPVYHGTADTFDTFDRTKTKSGPSKFGFWFAQDKDFAEMFGDKQMNVYLRMERPYRIASGKWNDIRDRHAKDTEWFERWRDRIAAQGYDGLIVDGEKFLTSSGMHLDDPTVYAVFEASQIKSVNNSGAFDPKQPGIYASSKARLPRQAKLPTVDTAAFRAKLRAWAQSLANIDLNAEGYVGDARLRKSFDEAFAPQVSLEFAEGYAASGGDLSLYIQGGHYLANHDRDEAPIAFVVSHGLATALHRLDWSKFTENPVWQAFEKRMTQVYVHEVTHQGQFTSMNQDLGERGGRDRFGEIMKGYSSADVKKYLFNQFEIGAFAREAVEEMRSGGLTDRDIFVYLRGGMIDALSNMSDKVKTYQKLRFTGPEGVRVWEKFYRNMVRSLDPKANQSVSREDYEVYEQLAPSHFRDVNKPRPDPKTQPRIQYEFKKAGESSQEAPQWLRRQYREMGAGDDPVGPAWKAIESNRQQLGEDRRASDNGERHTRVELAEDEWRLPNLLNVIPEHILGPVFTELISACAMDPERLVAIYRSVPPGIDEIRPGDWVALTHGYAKQHGRGKMLAREVPARDVVWAGTDQNEYFYAPGQSLPLESKKAKLPSRTATVPEIDVSDVATALDKAFAFIRGPKTGYPAINCLSDYLRSVKVGLRWANKQHQPASAAPLADYVLTGYHDPYDRTGLNVNVEFATGFDQALALRRHQSRQELDTLKQRILTLVTHERVHAYQRSQFDTDLTGRGVSRRDQFDIGDKYYQGAYLAHPDEIGAYAVHAVYELRQSGMPDDAILKNLRTYSNPETQEELGKRSVAFLKYKHMDDYVQAKRDNPGDVDPEFLTTDVFRAFIQKMVQYITQGGGKKAKLLLKATDPNRPGFLFPEIEPDLPGRWIPPGQPEPEEDDRSLEDQLDDAEGDAEAIARILARFEAYEVRQYPGGVLWSTGDDVIDVYGAERDSITYYDDIRDFIHGCKVEDYYPEIEGSFNKEFWENPCELYHATDEENLASILAKGLNADSRTRGMSNRDVAAAVFCTESIEYAEAGYYGDAILRIDMEAIKNAVSASRLPYVGREPDVEEGNMREALAHALGDQDYTYDYEDGMDPQTVIVYGAIAPRFISIEQGEVPGGKTAATMPVDLGEEEQQETPAPRKPKGPRRVRKPKPIEPAQAQKNLMTWAKGTKVVDAQGHPLPVYHGTTHDFSAFDASRSDREGHYGSALYFTSSNRDASKNYGGEGPDLISRIERESERIFNELVDAKVDSGELEKYPSYGSEEHRDISEEADRQARGRLVGPHGGWVISRSRSSRAVVPGSSCASTSVPARSPAPR